MPKEESELTTKASVTLRDVARACGLSVFPVSKALNNKPGVNPKTVAKVHEVAKKLGYDFSQNHLARRLALSKSGKKSINHVIGVLMPNHFEESNFFFELFKGITEAASKKNYGILLLSIYDSCEKKKIELNLPPIVIRGEVDGILINGALNNDELHYLRERTQFGHSPIVAMNYKSSIGPTFMKDHRKAGEMALEHLILKGHRKILYYTKGEDSIPFKDMYKGYEDACDKYSIDIKDCLFPILIKHDHLIEYSLEEDIKKYSDATALIAHNDPVAISSYYYLRKRGVEIPRKLSIIGQDDSTPLLNEKGVNILTTIRFDIADMGRRAAKLMIDMIENKTVKTDIDFLAPSLVERSTVTSVF